MIDLNKTSLDKLFEIAFNLALLSPDPSTQNGAVLLTQTGTWFGEILGSGRNEFPLGVEPRFTRPEKYFYIEHAERNAIYDALGGRFSTNLVPKVMVALWASCADCARGIIQSGVKTLYRHSFYSNYNHSNDSVDRMPWQDSIDAGDNMMIEAGIKIVEVNWSSGGRQILFNGELVTY